MSYVFHRSQRHGPNTRYFPELHSHPTGINVVPRELTAPLNLQEFGSLLLLYTSPGSARRVQLLLQIAFPHLQTFVPLTPLRWYTVNYASPEIQKKVRGQQAKKYRYKPDRNKDTNTSPNHPELNLAPTMTEMFSYKKMDFYLRLTQKITQLIAEGKPEKAQQLLDRVDYIPIKMHLRNTTVFESVVFIGVPRQDTVTNTDILQKQTPTKISAINPQLGLRLIEPNVLEAVGGTNGSFSQKIGRPKFSADPREAKPLRHSTDHLGMTQTDLARKYNVPLIGRRLRRRDEAPFEQNAEVQPDAWWEDPSSYLPGPSKRYLPPPKAYVEWLSEERALLTPSQLAEALKEDKHTKQEVTDSGGRTLTEKLRSTFQDLCSTILDHPSIRHRTRGFLFVKDQPKAFQELRALTLYLRRHRPHPQSEQKANRLTPLKDHEFWSGVRELYKPLRHHACIDSSVLDLGPRCVFSPENALHGLSGLSLKNYRASEGYTRFIRYSRVGKPRSYRMQKYFAQWFDNSLPKLIPEGCEPVLVKMPTLQLMLVFVVESSQVLVQDTNGEILDSNKVNPLMPSDLIEMIGAGAKMILGRNGVYHSKQIKMMDVGEWPDDPKLVLQMFKDVGLAFGVKPRLIEKILQPI